MNTLVIGQRERMALPISPRRCTRVATNARCRCSASASRSSGSASSKGRSTSCSAITSASSSEITKPARAGVGRARAVQAGPAVHVVGGGLERVRPCASRGAGCSAPSPSRGRGSRPRAPRARSSWRSRSSRASIRGAPPGRGLAVRHLPSHRLSCSGNERRDDSPTRRARWAVAEPRCGRRRSADPRVPRWEAARSIGSRHGTPTASPSLWNVARVLAKPLRRS